MVTPLISLRIRHAEATRNARKLLRELDEADLLQRRVKLQAAKALSAVHEVQALAAPKLRAMSRSNSDRWTSEMRRVEEVLTRMIKRGV